MDSSRKVEGAWLFRMTVATQQEMTERGKT
jgi:hypothetical protein